MRTRTMGRQSGMSLAEVIVAAALALIGFLVALVLYQAARQAFKKGEQATDQQQETRVAYDRMMKDLRLAGYNWNATGEDRSGEEQIEGAWDGAIAIRADYDFEDPTLSIDPENLISGTTTKATVGNDEIVTFCLAKDSDGDGTPDGGSTLTFNADVNSTTSATSSLYGSVAVRDGISDPINVPHIETNAAQNNPPYNLYRVTLNNTRSTYGSGNFYRFQLLAQNIKSLKFDYQDGNGLPITAPGGGETATDRSNRGRIKKITVTIVGMTAAPDKAYTDPTDGNAASRNYRKFSLTSAVTPRNLGFRGRADSDLTPPTVPTGLAVCPGHCNAMVVTWNPNPSADGVAQYQVRYGTNSLNLTTTISTSATNAYIQNLTAGTTYYFGVRATDASNNHSAYSSPVSAVVNDLSYPNHTVPAQPASFLGTGHGTAIGLANKVNLNWATVTNNEQSLTCDPAAPALRDFAGYRLYRSSTNPFTPATSNMLANETATAPAVDLVNRLDATTVSYADTNVVNCRSYFYHLRAVDNACNNESQIWSVAYDADASSSTAPAAPANVVPQRQNANTVAVTFSAVNQDVAAARITIDRYNVWVAQIDRTANPETATYSLAGTMGPGIATSGTLAFTHFPAPTDSPTQRLWYKVSALDDCPNESARSTATESTCAFNGAIAIAPVSSPPALQLGAAQLVTVSASGTDTFVSATLTISKSGVAETGFPQTQITTGGPWNFAWAPSGPGTFTATATVVNSQGCVSVVTNTWDVTTQACSNCATVVRLDPDPSSGNTKYYRQENQINNICAFPLLMTRVDLRAQRLGVAVNDPLRLGKVQYIETGNFVDETSNVVATFASPGAGVSMTQTAVIDLTGQPGGGVNLPSTSASAKIRFIFNATSADAGTQIWKSTSDTQKSILEANFTFFQSGSLCSPGNTGFQRLEITP